jgi:hypothetical protein
MKISAPTVFLSAILAAEAAQAGIVQVGTIPLSAAAIQSTTTSLEDRLAIALGKKVGSFVHPVPFQSESNVGGATVAGRNANIVSCSPAAVWMLLQSTGRLASATTFPDFISLAAADRDPTWGWTHEGFKVAAAQYGVDLEVNDFGDRTKFSTDQAWQELARDLAHGPVGLSIRQVDPTTQAPETKNTHMIVLRGAESDGQGKVDFVVNDPIAKSETAARNPSGPQARDHRVGVTTWPQEFVRTSSLDRWLAVSQ